MSEVAVQGHAVLQCRGREMRNEISLVNSFSQWFYVCSVYNFFEAVPDMQLCHNFSFFSVLSLAVHSSVK